MKLAKIIFTLFALAFIGCALTDFIDPVAGASLAIFPGLMSKRPANLSNMIGRVTPQSKALYVADKMGNRNIGKQQGTSRIIYDTLPIDGSTEFRFFEGTAARTFPFTNLDANSGKLSVGEVMVIETAQLTIITVDPVTGNITSMAAMTAVPAFTGGEISFMVGEQQVLKRLALQNFQGDFNKDGQTTTTNVYHFDTLISIQSLLEFVARVRPFNAVTIPNAFVRLTLEGAGSLFAAKTAQ
jgi:hypothetical protein